MSILEIKEVSKRYENAEGEAVKDWSLKVDKGAFISIEGVSGSGKSTLLMMMGGLLKPTDGKILYQGKDIYSMNDKELSAWRAKAVGYLFQNVQFVQALTVRENMVLSKMLGNSPGKDVEDIIKILALEDEADRLPGHLSGGQKRRAMVGCVMAREPKLILADEPTNDLDEYWAGKIMSLIKEYAEKGNAVILVTHDKRWTSLSTKRFTMYEGKMTDIL